MSADLADAATSGPTSHEDYEELLDVLDTLLDESLRKVESGRVYDAENERVRISWIRAAKDIVAEKRKVTKERDLEELSERVAELEQRRSDGDGGGL